LGHGGLGGGGVAGGDGLDQGAVFGQDLGADVAVVVQAEDVQVAVGALEGEADLLAARQRRDQQVEAVVVRGQ
jgi:hypothetical protein